jgi:hypothetical protein
MTTYTTNYTDSGIQATFKIINLLPQTYYNDRYQTDKYIDKLKANVSMGVLNIVANFNFSITYANKNKSGTIGIRGIFDPSYFTKKLKQTDGYL